MSEIQVAIPANPHGLQPLLLAGPLDLYAADNLKQQALTLLNAETDPVLDLSGIDRLHTACLQVLVATQKELAAKGRSLCLVSVGSSLRNLFHISGAEPLFTYKDEVTQDRLAQMDGSR